MLRKTVTAAALLLTSVALLTGCAPAQAPSAPVLTGPPVTGGTFHMALASDLPTLDPAQAGYDATSWSMVVAVFSSLVDYDEGLGVTGDLAETWTVSEDGLTYAFQLRDGLNFSDGSPLTTDDILFSFNRLLDPDTASPGSYLFSNIAGAADYMDGSADSISGITAPDKSNVVIELVEPQPYFANILAMPYARIMSEAQVKKYPEDISQHALGSGPFTVESLTPGQELVLARNPAYFIPGKPYLDKVQVDLNVSDQTRVLEFQRGDLSITDVPAAAYQELVQGKDFAPYVVQNEDATTYFLGMKNNQAPFDSAEVRQALNYAVDKDRLVQLLNGRGTVASQLTPPPLPGFDPDAKGYEHDVKKAKDLLAQAGYADGFSSEILTVNDEQSMRVVQSISADLAKVGVDVTINAVDQSTFYATVGAEDQAPMFFTYWLNYYPDAYDFFASLLLPENAGGSNMFYYSNPDVEAKIRELSSLTEGRAEAIQALDAEVTATAPFVYLYHSITQNVRQSDVSYYIHPVHLWRFADYWISGE
ncbi:MAG: peptide transporter substrate-binding protein [Naasia sp.]|uniref:ABC transporter substrate-binding protein n=1 Tax=Naasia sp. TaxID=2546198 RepID=UPI0026217672|nr:ABC transporter substrate-binding protein [Naasia sp.]MCU1571122.1 peptide transporter substrate-binding protein [Naasia sp.]